MNESQNSQTIDANDVIAALQEQVGQLSLDLAKQRALSTTYARQAEALQNALVQMSQKAQEGEPDVVSGEVIEPEPSPEV